MDRTQSVFSFENLSRYLNKGFVVEKHPSYDLYIWGYYSNKGIYWDDVSVHLRGLITDRSGNILARSFRKFFTFKRYLSRDLVLLGEGQTLKIPSNNYKVYEKLDGCLVFLYWIDNTPFLATQRSFSSQKAMRATKILHDKYKDSFTLFNRNHTYVFECIFEETKVIINYDNIEDLYLIGVVETATGYAMPLENIGFPLPYDYTEDLNFIKDLKTLQDLNLADKEGFVVVYEDGSRIKIKFPWYQTVHNMLNKIFSLHTEVYSETRKLKTYLNMDSNVLTKSQIISMLEKGADIESIKQHIHSVFYLFGVEHWLKEVVYEYNHKSVQRSEEDFLQVLRHIPEEHFSLDKSSEYLKDSRMWNTISRINNMFD